MPYLAQHSGSFYRITHEEIEARKRVASLDTDQRGVLSGIVMGKSLKTIAEEAGVAETQIEAVRAELLQRFGFRTTADLIRLGIYAGMTD